MKFPAKPVYIDAAAGQAGAATRGRTADGENVRLRRLIYAALFAVMPAGASVAPALAIEGDTVVLQGLDKVTARVWTFDAPVGQEVRFGTLEILPRFCDRTPPEEPPESSAFLDIYEARFGEERASLFHGWMFASSPALNALEHPVYDVWVIDCKVPETVPPPAASEPANR